MTHNDKPLASYFRHDRPQAADSDAKDKELLAYCIEQRAKKHAAYSGPLCGDYVIFADGCVRRVSHVYDFGDGPEDIQTSDTGSFHFNEFGSMDFSGGLYEAFSVDTLTDTGESEPGACWIFHHGFPGAGRAVGVMAPCKVWTTTENSAKI